MHANVAALAGGFIAMAAEDEAVALLVGGAQNRISQLKRSARGGILFETVVSFLNFDVVVIAEKFGGLGGEFEKNKDRQGHIGRLENGNVARGLFDGGVIGTLQAGRADEHGDAAIAA